MRRLTGHSDIPGVVETAVAPELDWKREPEPPRGPQLAAVNPAAARRTVPVQPSLFPYRDDQKLVSFAPAAPARHRSSGDGGHRSRRKTPEGQSAFDFDAPPLQNVLSQARDKNTHIAVAPIPLRTMAAMFDAGLAGAMTGLFLLTVRLTLGYLPAGNAAYAAYAAAAAAFFFLYKLLYCLYGLPTFGLQGARLRVVTFEGAQPSRAQLNIRLFAGCVSVASAGMGLLWPLADQDKLSWHDHISQTFLTCDPE